VNNPDVNNYFPLPEKALPDEVADAWASLSGEWKSDVSEDEEIAALVSSRSSGRDVDLSW
jgi:hypothetical protein